MSATLSTHVLDTALGQPAAGLVVELRALDLPNATVKQFVTNADGRVSDGLLNADESIPGRYELLFKAGDYWRAQGRAEALDDPLFLDEIPIRFGLAATGHHHVPLLLSPFSYSTYRGS
jgi:5-hydroxyisourate hydrolase